MISRALIVFTLAIPSLAAAVPVYWDVVYTSKNMGAWGNSIDIEESGIPIKTYGYFAYDDATIDVVQPTSAHNISPQNVSTLITEGSWNLTDNSTIEIPGFTRGEAWYTDASNGIEAGSMSYTKYGGEYILDNEWLSSGGARDPARATSMIFDYTGEDSASGRFGYSIFEVDSEYGYYSVGGTFIATLRDINITAVPTPNTALLFALGLGGLIVSRSRVIKRA